MTGCEIKQALWRASNGMIYYKYDTTRDGDAEVAAVATGVALAIAAGALIAFGLLSGNPGALEGGATAFGF